MDPHIPKDVQRIPKTLCGFPWNSKGILQISALLQNPPLDKNTKEFHADFLRTSKVFPWISVDSERNSDHLYRIPMEFHGFP